MPITLTLKKAAEESGLSIRTLYHAIGSGDLHSVKVGRRRLIPVKALEQFLLKGRCGPRRVRSAVETEDHEGVPIVQQTSPKEMQERGKIG